MENEELIAVETVLNDSGASPEAIDEILRMFAEKDVSLQPIKKDRELTEEEIKIRIMDETDWRKKAALSAMLISKSLSN